MFDEDQGYEPYKGWNRASVTYRSRKPYKPNIRAEDLVMPSGLGSMRALRLCIAMGLMITVLYVWSILFFLHFFVPLSGPVYGGVLGGAAITITALLYFFGARETRRDRELATRL